MNMNVLGKSLVMVHLSLAMIALTWATGLYFQFLDYGWIEPRKDLDKRVASEFEKRVATYVIAREEVKKDLPNLRAFSLDMHRMRQHFADNHVVYHDILQAMAAGEIPKGKKELRFPKITITDTGLLELKDANPYAPPKFLPGALEDVDDSRKGYVQRRKDYLKQIEDEIQLGRELNLKHTDITRLLLGKDGAKPGDAPGIYELLADEKIRQDEYRFELNYLEKIWAPVLQDAESLTRRKRELEKTRDSLPKMKKVEKGKG